MVNMQMVISYRPNREGEHDASGIYKSALGVHRPYDAVAVHFFNHLKTDKPAEGSMDTTRLVGSKTKSVLLFTVILLFANMPISASLGENTEDTDNFVFTEQGIIVLAQGAGEITLELQEGEIWIEFHCGSECVNLTVNLTDSSGQLLESNDAGEYIIIQGHVNSGTTLIQAHTTLDQISQLAYLQAVLPIGYWESTDHPGTIPSPAESTTEFTPIFVTDIVAGKEHTQGQEILWSKRETMDWINGSISNLDDVDVVQLSVDEGDAVEVWLENSNIALTVDIIARNNTAMETITTLSTTSNTSVFEMPTRSLVGVGEGEDIWIKISSPDVNGLYALRVAKHSSDIISGAAMGVDEEVALELPNSSAANTDFSPIYSKSTEANGIIVDNADEEDCMVYATEPESHEKQGAHYTTSLLISLENITSNFQYRINDEWYEVSTFNSYIGSENFETRTFFTPSGSSAIKMCLSSSKISSWVTYISTEVSPDTPGQLPSNSSLLNQSWSSLLLGSTTKGDFQTALYDSSDLYWYEMQGWPESEFLIQTTIDNLGDEEIRVTLQEVNWSRRDIIEAVNITVAGNSAADLTMKVGPGIHTLLVEHIKLQEQGGNWTWGGSPAINASNYQLYTTFIQTEAGDEPWFETDPSVTEASNQLLLFFGICLISPFIWVVLKQRARKQSALNLVGKKARLAHLLEILATGDVITAQQDLATNLRIISTLTWDEGIEVWGTPDLHHRTGSVDIAAWRLDRRMAQRGGIPILVGIHMVEDTWEVVGLCCEAPEGMAWEILRAEPKLLHRQDELFLDQLHRGSRLFVEIELQGTGSAVEFALSGIIAGEPAAMKTPKGISIDYSEE